MIFFGYCLEKGSFKEYLAGDWMNPLSITVHNEIRCSRRGLLLENDSVFVLCLDGANTLVILDFFKSAYIFGPCLVCEYI